MSAPIVFILLGIAMLVATGLFALGWIVPLIIGLTAKRRGTGHPRAWLVTAGIWGGMVLLVGIGILVARRTPAPVSTAVPDTSGLKDLAGTGEPAGTPMAFGPFLLAGAALGLVVGPALGDAYLSIVGWS